MKTTITKKATPTVTSVIAICYECGKKYKSWCGLVEYPICPYCNKREKPEGQLLF